jgi:hypothetical protein
MLVLVGPYLHTRASAAGSGRRLLNIMGVVGVGDPVRSRTGTEKLIFGVNSEQNFRLVTTRGALSRLLAADQEVGQGRAWLAGRASVRDIQRSNSRCKLPAVQNQYGINLAAMGFESSRCARRTGTNI